jgi:O-succinylbenzoic acid--CoA ligase
MDCLISKMARLRPEAPCVIGPAGQTSYWETEKVVESYAQQLSNLLSTPSGTLLVAAPAIAKSETIFWLYAILRQGFVAVPINPKLSAVSINQLLDRIGCEHLLPGNQDNLLPQKHRTREWKGSGKKSETQLKLEHPATLLFSSGSAGEPKAVVHSLQNHLSSAEGVQAAIPLQSHHRLLLALPVHHVSGLAILFRSAAAGAAVVIPEEKKSLAQVIRRDQVTHVSLVPFQLSDCISDFKKNGIPPSLETILVGGSSVPQALLREAHQMGLPVFISYGLTEMASTVAVAENKKNGTASFGKPLPGSQWKSVDGEIWVRGKSLCMGYWRDRKIEKCTNREGWLPTGDLGQKSSVGEFAIMGRKDDLFISGGENIFPEEIERALLRIPGVKRAFVCGVEDKRYGWRPVALVDANSFPNLNTIKENLGNFLPKIKIPDLFFRWPNEADESSFKISRKKLKVLVESLLVTTEERRF